MTTAVVLFFVVTAALHQRLPGAAAAAASTTTAGGLFAADGEQPQCPSLPCLNIGRGCTCEGNVSYTSPTDGQTYGTCTTCEKDWSGPACNVPVEACLNGGVEHTDPDGSDRCHCPVGWAGADCTERRCIVDWSQNRTEPPTASRNECGPKCEDGSYGLQCQLCNASSVCGDGNTCDRSLLPPAAGSGPSALKKNFECAVKKAPILHLLGGGRDVGGRASFSCRFEPDQGGHSDAPPAAESSREAQCSLAFYRVEPGDAWRDAFFFCSLTNCTATSHVTAGMDPSWSALPDRNSMARQAARGVLLVCALIVMLVHVVIPTPTFGKRRIVKACGGIILLTLALVIIVFGFNLSPTSLSVVRHFLHWNVTATDAVAKVTYTCPSTVCACAATPSSGPGKDYSPHCVGSLFGEHILPGLVHGATVDCDAQTGDCVFNQNDLNSPIALTCSSGDCVDKADAAADDARVVPGQKVTAKAPERTDKHAVATALCWFCVGAALLLIVGHWYWSKSQARIARLEFALKYLPESAAVSTTGGTPLDDRLGDGDDDASSNVPIVGGSSSDLLPNDGAASPSSVAAPYLSAQNQQQQRGWILDVRDLCYSVSTTAAPEDDDDEDDDDDDGNAPEASAAELHRRPWTGGLSPDSPSVNTSPHAHQRASDTARRGRQGRRARVMRAISRPRSTRKAVLDHVSMDAQPGECLALMGPSGAGKTSLLDLLAGRDKTGLVSGRISVAGETLLDVPATHPIAACTASAGPTAEAQTLVSVLVRPWLPGGRKWRRGGSPRRGQGGSGDEAQANDDEAAWAGARPVTPADRVDVARRVERFRSVSGYVAQQDTLQPTLTVRQTLKYAAQLKLPAAIPKAAIDGVVEQAIAALHLTHCADTMVGGSGGVRGLSGGERRRVSIGVELVGLPRVLFLDEPTSGLDSESALAVVKCLSTLARGRETSGSDDDDDDGANMYDMASPASGHHRHRRHHPFTPETLRPLLGRWVDVGRPAIVLSIHQPSADIYRLFDKVLLVHRGRAVYHGPADAAQLELRGLVTQVGEAAERTVDEEQSLSQRRSNVSLTDFNDADDGGALEADVEGRGSFLFGLPPQVVPASNGEEDSRQRTARRDRLLRRAFANPAEFLLATTSLLDPRDTTAIADAVADRKKQLQRGAGADQPSGSGDGQMSAFATEKRSYRRNIWQQFRVLARRSGWVLFGSYHLLAAHAGVTFLVGLMLSELYHAQPLDLPGTLNRAGSLAFLQLFLAFSTLSCLEAAVSEKTQLALELESSNYKSLPVLLTRVLFDVVPLRILPAALIGTIIYAPMGLRVDHGGYFVWFLFVLSLFSTVTSLLTYCVGLICPTLGSAALVSAVITLWNFVFGGLLVQPETIPELLKPFRTVSPFFLAYESLLVNELDGQTCTFAPADASGRPAQDSIPLFCAQYLYNMGLNPHAFSRDIALLGVWASVLFLAAWYLIATTRFVR